MAPSSPAPQPAPAAVADRVHSAAIHLLRRLRKQDDATGLTAARASALSVVVFAGPVTIGQLAQAEQVRAPTMTRLIMGMEADGLLVRARDLEDRRVVWIRATPLGARLLREGRRRRVAALARELGTLAAADLAVLSRAAVLMEAIAAGREPERRAGRRVRHPGPADRASGSG